MAFEGKFWLLHEEEPIDINSTQVVRLADGAVVDGRTGVHLGRYTEHAHGVDIVFRERDGDHEIARLRMSQSGEWQDGKLVVETPFDPEQDCYSVDYTSVLFEAYEASRPLPMNETDEERWDRQDREGDKFGLVNTYGAAMRDGPHIQEIHEENQRDFQRAFATVSSGGSGT